MSNLQLLNRAASATMCNVLGNFGAGLVGAAAYPLWAPQGRLVALGAGSLSLLAANYLCDPMDIGDAPSPDDKIDGCGQMAPGGWGQFQYNAGAGWVSITKYEWFNKAEVITLTQVYQKPSTGKWVAAASVKGQGGGSPYEVGEFDTQSEADAVVWRIDPRFGSCAYDPQVPIPPPPDGISDPIPYVDNTTNCTYNVSLQGFAQVYEGGPINPVLLIEGAQEQRANGGRIGGCNFAPVIYMPNPGGDGGGGDGPGVTFPVPDDGPGGGDDVPWWLPPLIAGTTAAVVNQILESLLGGGDGSGTISPGAFKMIAPCDFNEDGTQQQRTWEFDAPSLLPRVIEHQLGMMDMLQQHLDWKTPTCDNATPNLEGDFRTISFRSDQTSPYGKSRLRKRFRYRSVSGGDLDAVIDHWRDFSFESGPYRVRWVGKSWRSPEIWADTEAEGKRVIQHAATEAGFGPLEGGRWSTRLTSSSRLGVSGTMRVDTTGGYYWITERDGSSERPIVAKT